MAGKDCYWYIQGRCHLFVMEESMVYSILSKVPKARKDLLNCGHSCPQVDAAFLEFASKPSTLIAESHKIDEAHMSRVNRYVDYHRYVSANSTMPKPDTGSEEDE